MSAEKELSLLEEAKKGADRMRLLFTLGPAFVRLYRNEDRIDLDGDFTAQELRELADFMDASK